MPEALLDGRFGGTVEKAVFRPAPPLREPEAPVERLAQTGVQAQERLEWAQGVTIPGGNGRLRKHAANSALRATGSAWPGL